MSALGPSLQQVSASIDFLCTLPYEAGVANGFTIYTPSPPHPATLVP